MTVNNYLNKEGKIKVWPSRQEAKLAVARHLGNRFDTGRFYTEKEVNRIIDENHTFNDYFLLRREMIDRGAMRRTQDGARYWRGGLWPRDGAETERLRIRTAEEGDRSGIADVHRACAYMADWTGCPHDEAGLNALLANTDLPPGGSPEFSHLAVLEDKASGRLAGIAQYYTAWPEANCIWIGLMLIHPKYQKQGFGGEFVQAFVAESKRQAYARAGLGVALRNQPAMKFWVKSGFDRIGKVTADGEAGPGSLGTMGLYLTL